MGVAPHCLWPVTLFRARLESPSDHGRDSAANNGRSPPCTGLDCLAQVWNRITLKRVETAVGLPQPVASSGVGTVRAWLVSTSGSGC